MNDSDRRIAALARTQYGLITRAQALEHGFTLSAVDRRLAAGRWEPVLPGVYRVAGSPVTARQRALAAVLWSGPGCAISGLTAAALLRLDAPRPSGLELTVPRGRRLRCEVVTVRRTLALPDEDRRVVDGILCTSAARTSIDLASRLEREELTALVESARRSGLTTLTQLERRLDALSGRGRTGSAKLRRVLDELADRGGVMESRLEVKVWHIVRRSALPVPQRQFWVTVGNKRYRLDFAWPRRRVALECEGWEAHGRRLTWKRDRRRVADLGAAGWTVIPVTWHDAVEEPEQVVAWIAAALATRAS